MRTAQECQASLFARDDTEIIDLFSEPEYKVVSSSRTLISHWLVFYSFWNPPSRSYTEEYHEAVCDLLGPHFGPFSFSVSLNLHNSRNDLVGSLDHSHNCRSSLVRNWAYRLIDLLLKTGVSQWQS